MPGNTDMSITKAHVQLAYRKLKSYVYYDKTDLHLRVRLAQFECGSDFHHRLSAVQEVVNAPLPHRHPKFEAWLRDVNFRLAPKKISPGPQAQWSGNASSGRFITNVTSAGATNVEQVNYFFDGPIELHLVAVLWILMEGRILDSSLGAVCCGSRLSSKLSSGSDDSLELFAKYHEQYARWRDEGIRIAKQLLTDEMRNVAILGLDIQQYYYRVRVDFGEVRRALSPSLNQDHDVVRVSTLLACIEEIGIAYRDRIDSMLRITHPDITQDDVGLPIGLCSSLVLANWYLKIFDEEVLKKVRPAYYGRYVDDILLVVPVAGEPDLSNESPVDTAMREFLVDADILTMAVDQSYEVSVRPGLRLQSTKCILQYFDAQHSIAGLEKFQKKLEKNGSDFLLLPVDEADSSMEDVAYDLLYEGSANKFRSVKGMAENRYELAKHLARQTILHLLTDDAPDRNVSRGLLKFFKGRSAIEFCDLWERVFTLLGIADDEITLTNFRAQLELEVSRVAAVDISVSDKLKFDLLTHLRLSVAMVRAISHDLEAFYGWQEAGNLRQSNLLRHHFVRRPLLNYTTYEGALSTRSLNARTKLSLRKVRYSPRFVNLDECLLLVYSGDISLRGDSAFVRASAIFKKLNRRPVSGVRWDYARRGEL